MVEINNVTVNYKSGGKTIPALNSINLKIESGDYMSVLGPNGSGKSTFVKALCGLTPLFSGTIIIDGEEVVYGKFGEKLFVKIGVVFQEPSGQFLMPTVRKEIYTVLQNLGLSREDQKQRFGSIVEEFSLDNILDNSPERLSAGQMQLVNLACALATSPDLLILDEPTTYLDLNHREALLNKLDELHKKDLTIIHVTQYPDEAMRSEKTCIIESGKIVAVGNPSEVLADEELLKKNRLSMPRELTCRKLFDINIRDKKSIEKFIGGLNRKSGGVEEKNPAGENEKIFSIENLSFAYKTGSFTAEIKQLDLYKDQIVGLVGTTGSGKSTLALLLAGILKPDSGRINYRAKDILKYKPREFRKLVGLSWQMPEPVLIGPTVGDDLQLTYKSQGIKNIDMEKELLKIGLTGFEDRIVDTLSGGEKRKLSLASAMSLRPEYLILDEPAAFLDPVSQLDLLTIIREAVKNGCGALIIGHDLSFLSELTDRIIGLKEGRIVFDLPADRFFSNSEYCEKLGIGGDPIISFKNRLLNSGIDPGSVSLNPEILAVSMKNSCAWENDFS